jgi:uncharacterized protein YjdB
MSATVNSDLVIYNELAQTAYLERIQDVIRVFNAQSNGAIVLDNKMIEGDLSKKAFYRVGGSIAHRDVNSDAAVTPNKISAGEMVGVKVPFKYGPYAATDESFKRRMRNPNEFSFVVGQDYADAVMAGYIEYVMAALTASIGSNAAMNVTASIATDGKKSITKGFRAFGDRFSRIGLLVMDSATYFDYVDGAIDAKVFNEADVVIYGGTPGTLGKPVLITDRAPADKVFGLQAGAITVTESQLPAFKSYEINDRENLEIGLRGEGVFNLEVLGYSWKETAGINPNLATVGATASWEKYATSDKNTAGVIIELT